MSPRLTDITVADWLEVIRAEDHEIPNLHPLVPQIENPWGSDLLTVEALVTLAEVECPGVRVVMPTCRPIDAEEVPFRLALRATLLFQGLALVACSSEQRRKLGQFEWLVQHVINT